MISTDWGQNQHQQGTAMSSVTALSSVASGMVRRERSRSGDADAARLSVARKLRIGVGSLTNLIKRRVKSVPADLRDRLVALAIADLTNEINRLDHERQLLLQMGTSADHDDMRVVESALATARAAIERMR
jgi:hypothetical protein